ncbi:MAG: hypothetical protein JJ992_25215 [Planctomycetes bacterium]|nr:hypothetical protein [Planctomycetota bacterium]
MLHLLGKEPPQAWQSPLAWQSPHAATPQPAVDGRNLDAGQWLGVALSKDCTTLAREGRIAIGSGEVIGLGGSDPSGFIRPRHGRR